MDSAPPGSGPSRLLVLAVLALNFVLSPSIILLNKSLYSEVHFPNITLTAVHFLCTSVGMLIFRLAGLLTPKSVPVLKMLPVTFTFCGFVVLTNLSLQTNTVGTYQVIKVMTAPIVIIIQSVFYGRSFSTRIKFTIVPIMAGVLLNCGFDIKVSAVGLAVATTAVIVTALYQVWVAEKQRELGITSSQMLYYQAPLSTFLLIAIIPFFEPVFGPGGIFGGSWSTYAVSLVLLTGGVAFGINMSIFWLIGNTSPLTYNMAGHMKFCITILGGFLLFRDPFNILQILGIFVTFFGVIAYTYVKLEEEKAEKKENCHHDENENSLNTLEQSLLTTVDEVIPDDLESSESGISSTDEVHVHEKSGAQPNLTTSSQ